MCEKKNINFELAVLNAVLGSEKLLDIRIHDKK